VSLLFFQTTALGEVLGGGIQTALAHLHLVSEDDFRIYPTLTLNSLLVVFGDVCGFFVY
jgi:hypothetical protein